MKFLIADLIKLVSGATITFSKGGAAKIKSKQFSKFGSWTIRLYARLKVQICFKVYIKWHILLKIQ